MKQYSCLNCGKIFYDYAIINRKYCSRGCSLQKTGFKKGMEAKNRKMYLAEKELRILYHKKGMSTIAIAEKIGVCKKTVLKWMKRYKIPKRNLSEAYKLNPRAGTKNSFYGKTHPPEIRRILSRRMIGTHPSKKTLEKKSTAMRRKWEDPEFSIMMRKKLLASLIKKPNKVEKTVINLIEENNLPFKYVGDGGEIIGGKCPDFVSTDGSKRVIEVFGRVFHDPKKSFMEITHDKTEQGTIEHYRRYGYEAIIIWDDDLKRGDRIAEILRKELADAQN